jgi:hypothetical protein
MKHKLEQLTMAQFVELMSGNTSVLLEEGEKVDDKALYSAMRDIIYEYKNVSDPAGVGAFLSQSEKYVKARIAVIMYTMCSNLIALKRYDMAREVLSGYIPSMMKMPDKRLENEVKSRLAKAKSTVEEHEQTTLPEETDVHLRFDEQTAALMAYFKFQIDLATVKATVYAFLVARYNKEMKAKLAAIRKK